MLHFSILCIYAHNKVKCFCYHPVECNLKSCTSYLLPSYSQWMQSRLESWTVHASLCLYPYIKMVVILQNLMCTVSPKDEIMVVSSWLYHSPYCWQYTPWGIRCILMRNSGQSSSAIVQTKFRTGVNALHTQVSVYCLTIIQTGISLLYNPFGTLSHIVIITCHHYYDTGELIY